MAKFINKKEQVFDLKLTSYGHYLLSIGDFKPTYYAFYDDNVIYDGEYAGTSESQSGISNRIKKETQYLESLVLFEDADNIVATDKGTAVNFFDLDVTPMKESPRKDNFKFDSAIGDAFLDGATQSSPAWKIVSLQGEFSGSSARDTVGLRGNNIPQIDIELKYVKEIVDIEDISTTRTARDNLATSAVFSDNKVVNLKYDDLLLYADEVNTELLSENFDVEVFQVITGSSIGEESVLKRKYFLNTPSQIKDGFMTSEVPSAPSQSEQTDVNIGYYFNILRDSEIDEATVCKSAEVFNRTSYYVDIDFDCETQSREEVVFDIYGQVTEPEICQD